MMATRSKGQGQGDSVAPCSRSHSASSNGSAQTCTSTTQVAGITEADKRKCHLIKDPIYGSIELHPLLHWIVTKTLAFHRLKYIKQLSGLHYVYPGATHTRFEHSIGVCHLAGEFARMLIAKHRKSEDEALSAEDNKALSAEDIKARSAEGSAEDIKARRAKDNKALSAEDIKARDNKNILCVEIAGLCHDLGHGPFSHLFEAIVEHHHSTSEDHHKKKKPSHEQLSRMILKEMIFKGNEKTFKDYGIGGAEIEMIQNMIERSEDFDSDDLYLYEIVANKATGIDVDKWDYFIRDCHYMGLQHEFDYKRLMQLSEIREIRRAPENGKQRLKICYHEKEVNNILGMFRTRCSLHLKAYQHRKVKAVNYMLKTAMKKVMDIDLIYDAKGKKMQSIRNILDRLYMSPPDLEGYLALDDRIIHAILNKDPESLKANKHLLEESQKWIRDLYESKLPRRLDPKKVTAQAQACGLSYGTIFATMMREQDHTIIKAVVQMREQDHTIIKAVVQKLKLRETDSDQVFGEKIKISYISEEGLKSPLDKLYVYTDDRSIFPRLLSEDQYEKSLRLFTPEIYKLEEYWWYTTLEVKDDVIISAIAEVLQEKATPK